MTLDYTSQVRLNGESIARAAGPDLDAHVPSCPDWNVAKLVIHLGQHHRWVADAVRGGGAPPQDPPKPGLRGEELIAWFRDGWEELAELLDATDDVTPAWTWSGDNRVGFWRRRTALETLVHRWDVENAVGEPTALDPELASDGIDEMLFVMVPQGGGLYAGAPGDIVLRATETKAAWTITLQDGGVPATVRGGAGRPVSRETVVEGRAEDLLLFLWGRVGPEALQVDGDSGVFEGFLALVRS